MSLPRLTVFYEDKLGEPKPKNYGPHVLALACVSDFLAGKPSQYDLGRRTNAIALKGIDKLLARLRAEAAEHQWLVASLDDDRVRESPHLGLGDTACKAEVGAAIRTWTGCSGFVVVLLERNLDEVHDVCCELMHRSKPPKKPTPLERDHALHALAAADADRRRELLRQSRSFARLVLAASLWFKAHL